MSIKPTFNELAKQNRKRRDFLKKTTGILLATAVIGGLATFKNNYIETSADMKSGIYHSKRIYGIDLTEDTHFDIAYPCEGLPSGIESMIKKENKPLDPEKARKPINLGIATDIFYELNSDKLNLKDKTIVKPEINYYVPVFYKE